MCRGNNGQAIFLTDDGRRLFLSKLGEVAKQTGWLIHAYVLMSNHLNPYRAKLCGEGFEASLESYVWSSYPAYCGRVRKRPDWLIREKVLYTWALEEGETGASRAYRKKLERFMRMEADPHAGRRGEMDKQNRRGWYLGSEESRERLNRLLMGQFRKDTHRSSQRKDHGPAEAERLLKRALKEIGWTEEDLLRARGIVPEKQGVAWPLMTHTAVTGAWIAQRLRMGHRTNCSRAISSFRYGKRKG